MRILSAVDTVLDGSTGDLVASSGKFAIGLQELLSSHPGKCYHPRTAFNTTAAKNLTKLGGILGQVVSQSNQLQQVAEDNRNDEGRKIIMKNVLEGATGQANAIKTVLGHIDNAIQDFLHAMETKQASTHADSAAIDSTVMEGDRKLLHKADLRSEKAASMEIISAGLACIGAAQALFPGLLQAIGLPGVVQLPAALQAVDRECEVVDTTETDRRKGTVQFI